MWKLKQVSKQAMNVHWFLCHKGLVKDHEVIQCTKPAIQLSILS